MGIDINPSDVMRSADAVETAGRQAGHGDLPSTSGNAGFTTSEAISLFSSQMHGTTALAAANTSTAAEKLVASARLMRLVDDDNAGAARILWSKVAP